MKDLFKCYVCDFSSEYSNGLLEHTKIGHENVSKQVVESPSNSPPRKRLQTFIEESVDIPNLDDMDIDMIREVAYEKDLNKKINVLEIIVETMIEERKKDDATRISLKREIETLKIEKTQVVV